MKNFVVSAEITSHIYEIIHTNFAFSSMVIPESDNS